MSPSLQRLPALIAVLALAGCATMPGAPSPQDPLERINRSTHGFNDAIDRAVLKPVARGYVKVTPRLVRTGISNVTSHLAYTTVLVNDVLQLKPAAAAADVGRLALNTVLGLGGLLDPASAAGIPRNDEDFGQTLGRWGVPPGPYLVVPFLGPSTLRDVTGRVADRYTDATHYIEEDKVRYGLTALDLIDGRAGLLSLDATLESTYDPYAFIRNAYLQRRQYQVLDGNVPDDEPLEDPLEDPEPEVTPEADGAGDPAADQSNPGTSVAVSENGAR